MTGNKQVLTKLIISGNVQGVFFRAKTKKHADHLGLKGYVKNLSDGTVEVVIVGKETDTLIHLLKNEPPPLQIDRITRSTHPLHQNYQSFDIL